MNTKNSNTLFLLSVAAVVLIVVAFAAFSLGRSTPGDTALAPVVVIAPTRVSSVQNAPAPASTKTPRPTARPKQNTAQPKRTNTPQTYQAEGVAQDAAATAAPAAAYGDDLIMRNQRIYGLDGYLAFEGDIDLGPTFARIAAGKKDRHRNDGSMFGNREGLLPSKPRGYYTEWVIRTKGLSEVGPQRLITGKEGEAYYTPDHYITFVRVK